LNIKAELGSSSAQTKLMPLRYKAESGSSSAQTKSMPLRYKNSIKQYFVSSVTRRIILGVALVHALLMSVFVFDLVSRQRSFMVEQNTAQAKGLAETLAANGTSWILANDVVGIEEVIRSQSNFPGLDYALFTDMNGKVLGYTDRTKVGLYIKDNVSQQLLTANSKTVLLINNASFVDVASPVFINKKQIGWARVGVNRQEIVKNLSVVTYDGLLYTAIAIIVGVIFAWFIAIGLTSAIRQLTETVHKIIEGDRNVKCEINRLDEMGQLSEDFNLMLESIKKHELEIDKSHQALLENEGKLRRSEKMDALGKLTGGIAHDFNNMLGVIVGYADILLMKTEDQPQLSRFIEEIRIAGHRGKKLTKNLLSFSRRSELKPEKVRLNSLLLENQLLLEKSVTSKIEFSYCLAENLWPIWIDKSDMENSLVNLSINAMHAMPDGGMLTFNTKNVSVSAKESVMLDIEVGDYVNFSIIDTGEGMDENTKNQAFDPFFTTKDDLGTGLGLSQVYAFLKRSSGSVHVYSELGEGSHFSLYFPRFVDESESVIEQTECQQDCRGASELILVVDDDSALLVMQESILSLAGYRVLLASCGREALEILEIRQQSNDKICLMLSDIIMPEQDGYQLADVVSQLYPDVVIQLMSGFNDDRHLEHPQQVLHDKMLSKPFSNRELLQKLKVLLG
jgi:signal transduction histidine kinase